MNAYRASFRRILGTMTDNDERVISSPPFASVPFSPIEASLTGPTAVGWSKGIAERMASTGNLASSSTELLNQTTPLLFASIKQPFSLRIYNMENSTEHNIDLNLSLRLVIYVIYFIIFTVGILGNLLVCWVVFRQSAMRSVTNIFIANLALSDILLCLFCVPFTPLYLLTFKEWVFGKLLCHLVPFAQGVSVYISTLTLMSIAIERYSAILFPFRTPMTTSRCIALICFIWLIAAIFTLPYGIFIDVIYAYYIPKNIFEQNGTQLEVNRSEMLDRVNGTSKKFRPTLYCDEVWPSEQFRTAFGLCTSVIQFVIPFCIITFCYSRVCARLWDRIRTRPGSSNCSSQRKWLEKERARRTNKMLIAMVVMYLGCWLPLNSYNLADDFDGHVSNWHYSKNLFITFHVFAMLSICLNPILYAYMNDNFRKEFKSIFLEGGCLRFLVFSRGESARDASKEARQRANVPGQSNTGKKTDASTKVHNGKSGKNCTLTTELNRGGSDRKDADEVEVSMTVLDTTTNLVTNVESINEIELQESLLVTSIRNGIYANRVLPSSAPQTMADNKL